VSLCSNDVLEKSKINPDIEEIMLLDCHQNYLSNAKIVNINQHDIYNRFLYYFSVSIIHTVVVASVTAGGVILIIFTVLCCYCVCTGKRCLCCRYGDRRTYPATEAMVRNDTEFEFSPSKVTDSETHPKFMERRTARIVESPPPSYYRLRR